MAVARSNERCKLCCGSPVESVRPTILKCQSGKFLSEAAMSSRSDFEFGLNCRAVAIEVQAVKIEALLRLKRLLHHRAAIAARLLLRSPRPGWRVRDDQQSGAADEPDSSQVGCSSEFDYCWPQNWRATHCADAEALSSGETPLDSLRLARTDRSSAGLSRSRPARRP